MWRRTDVREEWNSHYAQAVHHPAFPSPPNSPAKPTPSAASSQGEAMVLDSTFWRLPFKIYDPVWSSASLIFSPFSLLHTLYSSRTCSWINNILPNNQSPNLKSEMCIRMLVKFETTKIWKYDWFKPMQNNEIKLKRK